MRSNNGTFFGKFQTERKLTAPTAIKDGEIFRVGLTRLLRCAEILTELTSL